MSTPILTYERQEIAAGQRMCGAAALCMAYRSFGHRCTQREVWQSISSADASGNLAGRSHLLCADALARGYAAMTLQLRAPWRALGLAEAHRIRIIVNHRMRLNSCGGHFAVVVRVEEDAIVLHDPQLGPERRVRQSEFLKLWRPGPNGSEVAGNIVVAIADSVREPSLCPQCGIVPPRTIDCPACGRPISAQPAKILGCASNACIERVWERLFCPFCDAAQSEIVT